MLSDLRTVEAAAPTVFLVALNLLWLTLVPYKIWRFSVLIESRILIVAQSQKRDKGAERVNLVS
jgi:hypothetical protein